jgi:hypothetical protein
MDFMPSLPDKPEAGSTGAEFLLADLEAALTFLNVAQTSGNAETVIRNHENARHAHDTVARLLQRVTLTADDRQIIEAKLAVLKERLEAVGS